MIYPPPPSRPPSPPPLHQSATPPASHGVGREGGWIERTGYSRDTRHPHRLPYTTLNSLSRRSIMLQRNSLTPLLLPDKFSIKTLTSLIPLSPPPPSPLPIVCPVCVCACNLCACVECVDDVLRVRVRGCQCDLERTGSRQVSDNFCEQGNNRKLHIYIYIYIP